MKHKFAIIFSTVMLFIVAVILSAAWLLKTRYFVVKDINGTIDGDIKSNVYSYVDETFRIRQERRYETSERKSLPPNNRREEIFSR